MFHEPFIHTGYRLPRQSWTYYATSIFRLHNESGNVWSHLAAFFVYLYATIYYGYQMDYLDNRSSWGVLGFGIACMIYALLSTVAHLFHSHSPQAHYTFFQIDYIGIGMYGQGMCLLLYTCSSTPRFLEIVYPYFLPINCCISIFVCVSCASAKMFFEKPHPYTRKFLQMGACLGHIVFLLTPMYFRVYDCFLSGEYNPNPHCQPDSFYPHYKYAFFFIMSAFLFVSHAPERFFPGRFDLFGHGHQLFHVCITYTTVLQFQAGYEDWKMLSSEQRDLVEQYVSFLPVFGCILLTICIDTIFILLARSRVREICETDTRQSNHSNGAIKNGAIKNGVSKNGVNKNGVNKNGHLKAH